MSYYPIHTLPSKFIPYHSDGNHPSLAVRKLTLSEVDFVFAHNDKPADIIRYLDEQQVVRGIPLTHLTVDDWSFVELTLTALTFPSAKFDIDNGKCPKCGDEIHYIELEMGGKTQKIEKRGKMQALLLPSDVSFKEIAPEVALPIEVELGGGTHTVDFYRLSHYLVLTDEGHLDTDKKCRQRVSQLLERHNKGEAVAADLAQAIAESERATKMLDRRRNELASGLSYDELEVGDDLVLNLLYSDVLSHGSINEFTTTCTVCSHQSKVRTSWVVTSYIPFRADSRAPRDRIVFGSAPRPANPTVKKPRVSSRPVALSEDTGDNS